MPNNPVENPSETKVLIDESMEKITGKVKDAIEINERLLSSQRPEDRRSVIYDSLLVPAQLCELARNLRSREAIDTIETAWARLAEQTRITGIDRQAWVEGQRNSQDPNVRNVKKIVESSLDPMTELSSMGTPLARIAEIDPETYLNTAQALEEFSREAIETLMLEINSRKSILTSEQIKQYGLLVEDTVALMEAQKAYGTKNLKGMSNMKGNLTRDTPFSANLKYTQKDGDDFLSGKTYTRGPHTGGF